MFSKSLFVIFSIFIYSFHETNGFDFNTFSKAVADHKLTDAELEIINSITEEQWMDIADFGVDSVEKEKVFEKNILSAQVTVKNGSLSHQSLLDSLANEKAKIDSEVAKKILRSSLYFHDLICINRNIDDSRCGSILSSIQIPKNTQLAKECEEIRGSKREGHHAFRRLLPRHYSDGIYALFSEDLLPPPRKVSNKAIENAGRAFSKDALNGEEHNLALAQWAQFIEQDLSKPVATSMSSGNAIECCSDDNFKLAPRYNHKACAPLLGWDTNMSHRRISCLNYVRSALAVGCNCNFAAAEQLNQATGYFDLSQLYGYTKEAEKRMRSFVNGELKSSELAETNEQLLPMASDNESYGFCAMKNTANKTICFMAGDSRVNANPFAIVIYTIFLRNHNKLAKELKEQYPKWDDETIFNTAKAINVDIYRRIIYHEWLPETLGKDLAKSINEIPLDGTSEHADDYHLSNEFGIAAIRFYFSMLPNALYNFATSNNKTDEPKVKSNNILPELNIFVLKDQLYKPDLKYTPMKLNDILESLLHQRAMRMDLTYVTSLIPDDGGSSRTPTHADILAFDIQRGRDHGLQPYVKYLEICENTKITSWQDLEKYIHKDDLNKLKNVYKDWNQIDLIIGGISEKMTDSKVVGPTFACILGEQFVQIRQWQHALGASSVNPNLLSAYKDLTGADLLCDNSNLKFVPRNIFRIVSENNRLLKCGEKL